MTPADHCAGAAATGAAAAAAAATIGEAGAIGGVLAQTHHLCPPAPAPRRRSRCRSRRSHGPQTGRSPTRPPWRRRPRPGRRRASPRRSGDPPSCRQKATEAPRYLLSNTYLYPQISYALAPPPFPPRHRVKRTKHPRSGLRWGSSLRRYRCQAPGRLWEGSPSQRAEGGQPWLWPWRWPSL